MVTAVRRVLCALYFLYRTFVNINYSFAYKHLNHAMEPLKRTTKGTLYITPAFHRFLYDKIQKNNMQAELNLSPTWRRKTVVSDNNILEEHFGIKGISLEEIEQVDYEATQTGLKFYTDIVEQWNGPMS